MRGISKSMAHDQGSALLEFAIVLPLLVVFIVGIYDFSGAFNQKQKIGHAAQMGAIVAGAQPMNDMDPNSGTAPDSLQPVVIVIFNSLVAEGLVDSGCAASQAPSHIGGLEWKYSFSGCPDNLDITIDRGVVDTSSTPATIRTVVTVSYLYHWRFNSAIQLLFPGASYAATTNLHETATVHNQT